MKFLQDIIKKCIRIYKDGPLVFWYKLTEKIKNIKLLLHGIWAIPGVLVIRALSPYLHIRLGEFDSNRIGHFIFGAAKQIAWLKEQPLNTIDWFWFSEETSNKQWSKMVERSLPCYSWVEYLRKWNLIIPGGEKHSHPSWYHPQDREGLFVKYDVKIPFLSEETREAKEWLYQHGWKDGEPFCCLLVRDQSYLKYSPIHGRGNERLFHPYSHNSFRDTDIATYVSAMEWLAEQGTWVIRMGKIMESPFPSKHSRIIDYAFSNKKNDLLDIWLFANCTGSISTSTGLDELSYVYDRPALLVNTHPLRMPKSSFKSIWVPKHHIWSKNRQPLDLSECFQISDSSTYKLTEAGTELVDLNPDEILQAVKEFWQRIHGDWVENEEDAFLQKSFWDYFETFNKTSPAGQFHGWKHPESRIGAAWLRSKKELFFE